MYFITQLSAALQLFLSAHVLAGVVVGCTRQGQEHEEDWHDAELDAI